ncbi:helix-turn-helix domain-containing protein [Micromonospora sp. LOL_024]|uniref:helix-turn-helix domain-containing protein n=1 Tax=Micromonospora sp. LOL_024 TaxID=3345412 RepID=UPI003A837F31
MSLLRRVIGAVLRRERQRQSRTLREVARAAGVSVPYLSEVERGRKEASSEVLAAICRALDLYLSDLLEEVRDELRRVERRLPAAPKAGHVPIARHGAPAVATSAGRGTDGSTHPVARLNGLGFGSEVILPGGTGIAGNQVSTSSPGLGPGGKLVAGRFPGGEPGIAAPRFGGGSSGGFRSGLRHDAPGSILDGGLLGAGLDGSIRIVVFADPPAGIEAIVHSPAHRHLPAGWRAGGSRRAPAQARSAVAATRRGRTLARTRRWLRALSASTAGLGGATGG